MKRKMKEENKDIFFFLKQEKSVSFSECLDSAEATFRDNTYIYLYISKPFVLSFFHWIEKTK